MGEDSKSFHLPLLDTTSYDTEEIRKQQYQYKNILGIHVKKFTDYLTHLIFNNSILSPFFFFMIDKMDSKRSLNCSAFNNTIISNLEMVETINILLNGVAGEAEVVYFCNSFVRFENNLLQKNDSMILMNNIIINDQEVISNKLITNKASFQDIYNEYLQCHNLKPCHIFIAGGPNSGKTPIAKLLAEK